MRRLSVTTPADRENRIAVRVSAVPWPQALNEGPVFLGIGHLTTITENQMMGQMTGESAPMMSLVFPARTMSRKLRFLMIANSTGIAG